MDAHAHVTDRVRRVASLHGIYAIVNESPDCLAIARAIVNAGICVVQYRAKQGIVANTLHALRAATREAGALLIVNDDVDAVRAFECDGVHLGPDDAGFFDARRVRAALPDGIIGLSCGTVEEAAPHRTAGADYLGVGAVFATSSKADAGAPIGVDGLRRVAAQTSLPVAAIGGITIDNVVEVRRTGVAMAAVISAISNAQDPGTAARALVTAWVEPIFE